MMEKERQAVSPREALSFQTFMDVKEFHLAVGL